MQRDIVITRANIGQIGSFVGATALLMGLLGLVWQGGFTEYITATLIVGALGILAWAIMTPAEFRDFILGRRARRGTIAVFSVLLFIGIVTMIYIFIERAVITFDMTETRSFTLSPETHRVLDQINRPIRITGFYSPELAIAREIDDQFFRQYEVESDGLVTREYIDPIQEPTRAEFFGARDGDVFLSYLTEAGEIDVSSISYVPMEGRQERDMTQAIARLLVRGNFNAYFDISHGEIDLGDTSTRGINLALQLLDANGFNVRPLDLRNLGQSGGGVPADASVVVLTRPQEQLAPAVIDVLDTYLDSGGSLFIMADVQYTDAPFLAEDSAFNTYLWESWGIRMLDAVAVDFAASGPSPLDVISAIIYDSPISANINPDADLDSRTQFRIARTIQVNPEPPVANGSVILSSPESYGETDLTTLGQTGEYDLDQSSDIAPPLVLVAYAIDQETDGRVLLVGDSDFVTDGQIGSPTGNAYLFTDGMGWLTDFNQEVSFTPVASGFGQPLLFISTQQLDQITFFTMIVMPGLALALGTAVWFYRSRQ